LQGHEGFRSGYQSGCWGGLLAGLAELGGRGVIVPVDDDEIMEILERALPGEAPAAARAVATACRFRVGRHSGAEALATAYTWLERVESAVAECRVDTSPVLATWLDQARAELASVAGNQPDPPWATIAERWRHLGRPYPEAYATYRHADAKLRASPRRSRATRQATAASLRHAHEIATSLGAAPLAGDIENLAGRSRLDLASARQPEQPAPAPYGLTAREVEVVMLMLDGCTDREIAAELYISRKTASLHVSNILRKTGATNRFDAAAIVGNLVGRHGPHDRASGPR
jgi:DNA-binding CsgD family transcriptional regulator